MLQHCFAQSISQKLEKAYEHFGNDEQLKHAVASLYVIDATTGKVLFDKNSQVGLAPASTQKVITAVTAFAMLGKDFRYKTDFSLIKDRNPGRSGYYITGSGDPTFGSDRYPSTVDTIILAQFFNAFKAKAVDQNKMDLLIINRGLMDIPDGWIWQDLGNYYGAYSSGLNWRENQYDLIFQSGNPGDPAEIVETDPRLPGVIYDNKVVSGTTGSGDNSYIYFGPGGDTFLVKGSVPPGKNRFGISGSMPDPEHVFLNQFVAYFSDSKRRLPVEIGQVKENRDFGHISHEEGETGATVTTTICTHFSPSLDSIVYWFLRKSINLYGESLIKTFEDRKTGLGSRDSGIVKLKDFWKQKGIDANELNVYDGSGLSPLNRVTTHAEVQVLAYAKKQSWFSYFYDALPEYNHMKMKSGTIGDVKSFCGYHASKDGKEYIFSFIVNNYNGLSVTLVNKMFKVLDSLK
jgi:D-alanyl-D-alanine carboxypeptidase/D-alanyl-D-alanine-endopeptidase (penicillin-binding protein 4)